jgi:SprT protein
MPYNKEPLEALAQFLPPNTFESVLPYLKEYKIQLSITKERKSIQGNYKFNAAQQSNKISINGNLNIYSFLITLIHEIAHCVAINKLGVRIAPHGAEWQNIYSEILLEFAALNAFPESLLKPLHKHINAPKASCSDVVLEKALDAFDTNIPEPLEYIDEIGIGNLFEAHNKKVYQIIEKRRTRFLCKEKVTEKMFLFAAHYKAKRIHE